MAKSRPHFPAQDVLSSAQGSVRSRDWEGPSRWTEYLGPEIASRNNGGAEGTASQNSSSSSQNQKGLNMQWVYELTHVAEGLMAKMYRLNQILDYPDLNNHIYSEAFWKAGLFPNHPKICILLEKKFPEHHSKLQLERVALLDPFFFFFLVSDILSGFFCFELALKYQRFMDFCGRLIGLLWMLLMIVRRFICRAWSHGFRLLTMNSIIYSLSCLTFLAFYLQSTWIVVIVGINLLLP